MRLTYQSSATESLTDVSEQVQTLLADPRSQELYDLLRREREVASLTTQDLINARKNTEKVLGPDENLFRIDWVCIPILHPHFFVGELTFFGGLVTRDEDDYDTITWER